MDIRSFFGAGRKSTTDSKSGIVKTAETAEVSSTKNKLTGPSNSNKTVSNRSLIVQDDSEEEEFDERKENVAAVLEDAPANIKHDTLIVNDSAAVSTSTNVTAVKNNSKATETPKVPKKASSSSSSSSSSANVRREEVKSDSEETVRISSGAQKRIKWAARDPVPYMALVDAFDDISKVGGRLDKEIIFTQLFTAVATTTPSDLECIVFLASNKIAPAYETGMELGIGDSLLVKAVCEATGRKKEAVEEAYEKEGDLGSVALASRAQQKVLSFAAKPQPLQARQVLEQFRLIAKTKGDKAQARKVDIIKKMMVKCQSNSSEAKYIVRALQGKLRIGTAEQTVLVALAHTFADIQVRATSDNSMDDTEAGGVEVEEEDDVKDEVEQKIEAGKPDEGDISESRLSDDLLELIDSIQDKPTPEALQLRKLVKKRSTGDNSNAYQYAEMAIKRAFSECPNLALLISSLLKSPLYDLFRTCRLTLGVPVSPMLAKPTKEIGEVLRRLSGLAFTMEYKYDGERAQVHLIEEPTRSGQVIHPNSVKIFSRNSEDNTGKYPDLMDVVRRAVCKEVRSFIIDAEVVAYDREKGCLLPFQILSTRKRKVEEGEEDNQKVKIVLQVFDLLYVNGKSLLRESLRTRRGLLHRCFTPVEGYLTFASGSDAVENGDTAPIEMFLQESCASMCEGLMVKTLDSNASYEPSKRSLNWLKLKKDYIDGMGVCDSVDLVVIGGYYGRGKRANTYGAYLMACYDPDTDESVCKVGTGFKDEDLARLFEKMRALAVESKKKPYNYNVGDGLLPDDWFQASVVWELQAADLSKSSAHKGGIGRVGDPGRGIGLRFPRYLRDREDKKPEQATTAEQIVDMFFSQGGTGQGAPAEEEGNEDDDFDGI